MAETTQETVYYRMPALGSEIRVPLTEELAHGFIEEYGWAHPDNPKIGKRIQSLMAQGRKTVAARVYKGGYSNRFRIQLKPEGGGRAIKVTQADDVIDLICPELTLNQEILSVGAPDLGLEIVRGTPLDH